METPQPGIFVEGSPHHLFLEFSLQGGLDRATTENALLAAIALHRRRQGEAPNLVIAFGANLWARMAPSQSPKALRPFEPIEGPNGELGFYVVADGTNIPWRAATRPPSFMNFQVFAKLLEGHMLADLVAVLGSLNIIAAELDR